ncbi:carbohydrate ABC transporter permease [Acetatifactor muris]|jgi:putative aldouronate transport system permease protein|uniref:L-arabinose transport system permease protein AraQ n=1 Tax=Acetatifactor muris TaxID=879566 RepID=A0A2K4ZKZ1_9FIRM|nr:carbohydrate ABC transporter permease [Acetatifactor muris]MCR2050092.1 carbohydrate ABC transporter permease [Acetatifactor muris]SOY31153.1 L-arabinose transport system permease protein AraQ [Acetatifactor muris]
MKKKGITQDKIVYFVNDLLLLCFALVVLYPILYVVSCSFSSGDALLGGKVRLLPVGFTFEGYKTVFGYTSIWVGYKNTVIYTVIGVIISVVMTLLAAYPLSRDDFKGKKFFTILFIFTMMFSGGMIPSYLLVKNLKLLDTMWSVILPGCVSAYNVVVARTFFKQSIPKELLEAAEMDGCSDFRFFSRIVVPLSKAIIAVMCLWCAMPLWNGYFNAMIYLNSEEKYTLQLVLRRILLMSKIDLTNIGSLDLELIAKNQYLSEMLKYGTIVLSTLPLMILYPFIQKHFAKGVMIGSVKG